LLRGAYDESRDQLRELWAALIAAAMDPDRTGRVRLSFIDALRQFDPLDALVLKCRNDVSGSPTPNSLECVQIRLGAPLEEIMISVANLGRLNCAEYPSAIQFFGITPFGRGLLRAVSD